MNDYLYELRSDPRFTSLMETIMKHRPVVPFHDPVNDNTEIWKSRSAERRGFDVWVTFLKLENNNNE